ncbi:MAG TPA: hypothetical protein VK687_15245 [Bryobacteraceae bacterium]|nr:hypothetical protein [Bryobacteraceae bacterium]
MRGLLILLMSLTLAATGFAQSRGGGGGFRGGGRSFAGGVVGNVVRGAFGGGGFGRGFGNFNRGFVGGRRGYGGFYGGYGYGLGFYDPYYYNPYYYGPYYYGAYAPYGYYAPPVAPVVVPRAVIAPGPGVIVGGWRRFGWR